MLEIFGVLCFFLTTVFFFKGTTIGLVGLNAGFFFTAWRTHTLPKNPSLPLIFWGALCLYMTCHSFFWATDSALSLNASFRLLSLFLQVAFLQIWISNPLLLFQTLKFSPEKPPLFSFMTLFLICFAGLQIQFFHEGLLTSFLNQILMTSFPIPRTFKPYLALLIPPFFLLMGMTLRQFSGPLKAVPLFFLGFALLVFGFFMHAYTDCLAIFFGFIAFFAYLAFPRITLILTALGIFVTLWLLPFYVHYLWQNEFLRLFATSLFTFGQRALHWSELLPFIREKFWLGWGLKHSYILSSGDDVVYPLMYPHNIVLELWIDLGFIGVLWASAFIGMLLWFFFRSQSRIGTASGLALLVSAFTMGQAGYSNLHIWWASSLSLCAFFIQAWITLPERLEHERNLLGSS